MSTTYKSTRGSQRSVCFEDVVLSGLSIDKGLFIPEDIPSFSTEELYSLKQLKFADLAFNIMRNFVKDDQIPAEILRVIVNRSFSDFRDPNVVPVIKLNNFYVMELFHGPTFAFKDVALQFLGNLFEYFLARGRKQKSLTILGATSGDTGSAAIHGLKGKSNVNCFILFPFKKVTEVQERQMTTIADQNVHCISVQGDFDDCQALVKSAFSDERFRDEVNLGAINSINWARILAQITYYFSTYFQILSESPSQSIEVSFSVPTGNFGDILAGYYAKRMGLPIKQLIIATNENNVLERFFQTGIYERRPAVQTIAPSMDISVSSNFERYLYYLSGENSDTLAAWMNSFEKQGRIQLDQEILRLAQRDFIARSASEKDIFNVVSQTYLAEKYLLCPHTATAVHALTSTTTTTPMVVLATAHPAKFESATNAALSSIKNEVTTLPQPKELSRLFSLPTRVVYMQNNLASVREFIRSKKALDTMLKTDSKESDKEVLVNAKVTSLTVVILMASIAWFKSLK